VSQKIISWLSVRGLSTNVNCVNAARST